MSRSAIALRMFAGCIAVSLFVTASTYAVPNRESRGNTEPAELPTIDLKSLKVGDGAAFGDWAIWRYNNGGESYFVINRKTNLVVYLNWDSNGWINFRKSDGTWHILYSNGAPGPTNCPDLDAAPYLAKQPTVRVAPDKYTVKGWTITVTGDTMEFFIPNVRSQMTMRASSEEVTHNDRTITAK
jgi:hypothetical protein